MGRLTRSKIGNFFKNFSKRKRHYTGAAGRNIKCLLKDRIQMGTGNNNMPEAISTLLDIADYYDINIPLESYQWRRSEEAQR